MTHMLVTIEIVEMMVMMVITTLMVIMVMMMMMIDREVMITVMVTAIL